MSDASREILGFSLRRWLIIFGIVNAFLVIIIYETLSTSQLQEIKALRHETVALNALLNDVKRNVYSLNATLGEQRKRTFQLEKDVFQLRCDLAKGVLNRNDMSCKIGNLTEQFRAPAE